LISTALSVLKQAVGIVQPAGGEIRLQKGELNEVDLRTATADALTLAEHRPDRIDCAEVPPLERGKRASEGRVKISVQDWL